MLVIGGRVFAVAGVALGIVPCFIVFYRFDSGDEIFDYSIWGRIALCIWSIVPLPIAWWIGRRIARSTAALAVLVAGMALALAYEACIFWGAFPLDVAASLGVIGTPLFQMLFLAVIVLFAWVTDRWISWRSSRPPSADR